MTLNGDSSPFQSSPFNASEGNSSPRLFWQGRDPATPNRFNSENNGLFAGRESSPSPTRRSSIERLQRASRVKNSNMFAREQKQEYDPTSIPVIERPLAKQLQGNAYGGSGLEGLRSAERQRPLGLQRNDSVTGIPLYSPTKTPLKSGANGLRSPSKDQVSPTKSSLSIGRFNGKSSFDSENGGQWSEDNNSGDERALPPGRVLHRHAKSVTFDQAPPQVNEYEMATPDLSSIGTGSRENSYESGEDEDEDSYNIHGDSIEQDDSFDASLEDTDKTPVVGPDDWRHASPEAHRNGIMSGNFEDPFEGPEGSPMPDARPTSSGRQAATRNDSLNSNGDHRPLPPLPGMGHVRTNSTSSNGLSAAAERATQRGLPSPPAAASISKSDIQGMAGGKMTLEERLQLMMIQDEEKPKSVAEQQRERRMRRAGPRERQQSQTPEREQSITIHEDEDTLDDLPGLGTYQLPPRISRESIMRKVNGQEAFSRDSDYNFSSPMPSSSPERATALDPDTPLPSTEDVSVIENDDSIAIKDEPVDDEEDEVDVYAIPEMYQTDEAKVDDYDNAHLNPTEDEAESDVSDLTPSNIQPPLQSSNALSDDNLPTPTAESPVPQEPMKGERKNSLPEFKSFLGNSDFGLSLQSYMTPSPPPPPPKDAELVRAPSMSEAQEYLQRPETPQERPMPSLKPEYDGTGWGSEEEEEFDSGTPDSVIRHPLGKDQFPPRDSPSIPEQVATIKSSGSKLKTRPSATPSDLMSMREMRRQVSGETPNIPPIPERHRNRPSLSVDREIAEEEETENRVDRHPSFKKRSLTLDIGSDLGLGLDQDFDRVIEAQKVIFDPPSSNYVSAFLKSNNGQASNPCDNPAFKYYANLSPRKQRGYLMRQNTKLIVASSDDKGDGTRSAGNSPVKKDRPQSWTVEPWNGQMRKSSVRDRSNPRKKPAPGSIPPMPGQDSNVTGLGIVTEEQNVTEPTPEDAGERGRLFVKVIGVKDLDLPLPKSEPPNSTLKPHC